MGQVQDVVVGKIKEKQKKEMDSYTVKYSTSQAFTTVSWEAEKKRIFQSFNENWDLWYEKEQEVNVFPNMLRQIMTVVTCVWHVCDTVYDNSAIT